MRVCDICKSEYVQYNTTAVVDDKGHVESLELCRPCYLEFNRRETLHKYQAYQETVKAVGGETSRKFHWWNMFSLW